MKKLRLILVFSLILALLMGCQPTSVETTASTDSTQATYKEVPFIEAYVDYFKAPYSTLMLIHESDEIFIGKIVEISYFVQLLKISDRYEICTRYTIEIQRSFRGDCTGTVYYCEYGGNPNYNLQEQYALAEKYGLGRIGLTDGMKLPQMGETYMFAFRDDQPQRDSVSIFEITLDPNAAYVCDLRHDQYLFEIDEDEVVTDETVPSYRTLMDYYIRYEENNK